MKELIQTGIVNLKALRQLMRGIFMRPKKSVVVRKDRTIVHFYRTDGTHAGSSRLT